MAETVRVFTERDVELLMARGVAQVQRVQGDVLADGRRFKVQDAQDVLVKVLAEFKGELTEEVIALSAVKRLVGVALAYTPGGVRRGLAAEEPGLPGEVWDELHERGLVVTNRVGPGESATFVTTEGVEWLVAVVAGGG